MRFKLILPFVLFVFYGATLLFTIMIEEPYPAIFQPAFQRAAADPRQINTIDAKAEILGRSGSSTTTEMEVFFPYLPVDRGPKLFKLLAREIRRPYSIPDRSLPGQLILSSYDRAMLRKREKELPLLKDYLFKRAKALINEEPATLILYLNELQITLPEGQECSTRSDSLVFNFSTEVGQ